jgi:hypothetical protein
VTDQIRAAATRAADRLRRGRKPDGSALSRPGGFQADCTTRVPSGRAKCASIPSFSTIALVRPSGNSENAVESASAVVARGAMTETAR